MIKNIDFEIRMRIHIASGWRLESITFFSFKYWSSLKIKDQILINMLRFVWKFPLYTD